MRCQCNSNKSGTRRMHNQKKTTPVCAASPSFPLTYHGNTQVTTNIINKTYYEPVKIIDEISSDLILGMKFLRKHRAIIDCDKGEIRRWKRHPDGQKIPRKTRQRRLILYRKRGY